MSDPQTFDLNALRGCCQRELAFRKRCYPRWVEKGTITEKKAAQELELMRLACDYFTDAIFRDVTKGRLAPDEERGTVGPLT